MRGPFAQIPYGCKLRLSSSFGHKTQIVCDEYAINVSARFRSLLYLYGNSRSPFRKPSTRAVPNESPLPIHAHFIVRVNQIPRAELVAEDLSPVLSDADTKILRAFCPVRVAHPDFVFARSRNLQVLIDRRASFICARRSRVPFALASLRPFRRNARSIHSPARSFGARLLRPRRIQDRLVALCLRKAAHVLGLVPEIFKLA